MGEYSEELTGPLKGIASVSGSRPRDSFAKGFVHFARRNYLVIIGGGLLLVLLILGVFATQLAPADPIAPNLRARNQPPGWQGEDGEIRYLGTDHLGRDLVSRLLYGLRVSLIVGFSAMLMGAIVGTLLGLLSGFYGGLADSITMGIVDIQMSFPYILLAIVLAAFWGTGLLQIVVIVAIRGWVDYARVVRGSVLSTREATFIEASRALGTSDLRILFAHILPNILAPAVIIASYQVGRAIVLEATLSFLGLGIAPPTPSLGGILTDGRGYLATGWWAVAGSGAVLVLLVLAINLLGDGIRDVFDSRID